MKKTLALVLAVMLLVVLGCSLGGGAKKDDAVPTPAADKPITTTSEAPTDSPPASSSAANLTIESFNKIKFDMSYDEVKNIMGSDGDETSSSKSGNYESKTYQWKDEGKRVITRFRNGKLASRNQFGLTGNDGTADIDMAKFNKLNLGMSYDDVKGVIGDGELSSESKIGKIVLASYVWKGAKFARIRLSFKDAKLSNKNQSRLK